MSKKIFVKTLIFFLILSAAFAVFAAEKPKTEIKIDRWLVLGPVTLYQPILNNTAPKPFGLKEILDWNQFEISDYKLPEDKTEIAFPIPDGAKAIWKKLDSSEISIEKPSKESFNAVYLTSYLTSKEFLKVSLELKSTASYNIYYDGRSIKQESDIKDGENKKASVPVSIEPGFHILSVKMILKPGNVKKSDFHFSAGIVLSDKEASKEISLSNSPKHNFTTFEILNLPTITNASISADGVYTLVSLSLTRDPEGNTERWFEIRKTEDGSLVKSYRGLGNVGQTQFAPGSNRIAFTSYLKDSATLWLMDLISGDSKPLLQDIKNFERFSWSPDERYLIYSVSSEEEKDNTGVKKIESIRDRQAGYRNKSSLYILGIDGDVKLPVSISDQNSQLADISPDGKNILITKEIEDYTERPYYKTELYNLDITNMHCELLLKTPFFNDALWSPDGKQILILGGPSLFGNLGKAISDDKIANEYDVQAYIFDPKSKDAVPISKNFDPSIERAQWSKADGNIYFSAADGQRHLVYKYSVKDAKYSKIDVPLQSIRGMDIAIKNPLGICVGTTTDYPAVLYSFNGSDCSAKLLFDSVREYMKLINTGKVEEWSFVNKDGIKIDGRIHFPPDFDPAKKYPCIVHYYGGTSTIDMSYGGRYPNNWWAALGYIVYVVQPRGTVGYGQDYSAYHVNDWGKYALYDIIEGTEKLLASHSYIDPKRVGCIGASYGGFTTELLVARTNIFAAAISHAGISSLASYWGGGYWGFEYSGVATADKFPWNARDIYIDRSPLYNADKINTPLLLLHGSVDTNVPTLESDYLYTALKLLGKEVQYIKVLDQDHWVLDYKKRIQWYKTIIAWFDMYLKEKPAFWENLYPMQKMQDEK